MASDRRVAVVGAGIIGLTVALRLVERGASVVVVDRSAPGSGASAAANGALTPHSDHTVPDFISKLALRSIDRYPEHLIRLKELSGCRVDTQASGVVELFFDHKERDAGELAFDAMKSKDWPVEWLDRSAVLKLEPKVNRSVIAGVHYLRESSIDISQLVSASAVALERSDCVISFPTEVHGVHQSDSGPVVVSTSTGTFECDQAVLCPGAGSLKVGDLPLPRMRRIRGEILEMWGPPGAISRCLYWGDAFLTPRRDGRILVGTSYVEHRPGMDENIETVSIAGAVSQLNATLQISPEFEAYELRRVWKSWRPTSSDLLPVIGSYGSPNIILAMGFSGLGFTLAPIAADLVAELVFGDQVSPLLESLSPSRSDLEFVE